jgi:serine/threonine protein kinase
LNVNELDKPFYTMKLVRGDSLAAALTGLRLERPAALERYPLGELLAIFLRVCDAIGYAHSRGVVHRDLKPDNILIGAFGETVVMDWGLAKPLEQRADQTFQPTSIHTMVNSARQDDSSLRTAVGMALGTPQYMAPEQASGQSSTVDARADIYGLGGLLYSLLTLQPPVAGGDPRMVLELVVAGKIVPPAEAIRRRPVSHLPEGKPPPELAEIAMKALSLNPADRYGSVRALKAALSGPQTAGKPRGGLFGLDALFVGKAPKSGK